MAPVGMATSRRGFATSVKLQARSKTTFEACVTDAQSTNKLGQVAPCDWGGPSDAQTGVNIYHSTEITRDHFTFYCHAAQRSVSLRCAANHVISTVGP